MKLIFVCVHLFAFVVLAKSEVCRVGVVCTDGGRTDLKYKVVPKPSDYIVEVVPTIGGPIKLTGDRTASSMCKEPGWMTGPGGYQYTTYSALTDWQTAVKLCRGDGASLPLHAFDNEEMYNFFRSYLKNQKEWAFWLPLSDQYREGSWVWNDGRRLTNAYDKYWQENQPDNSGEQDCAYMNRDTGLWDDGQCHGTMSVVCERKIKM